MSDGYLKIMNLKDLKWEFREDSDFISSDEKYYDSNEIIHISWDV